MFTVENKQNGADNNVVIIAAANPYHLIVTDRDHHLSGERKKLGKWYRVSHSPDEKKWFYWSVDYQLFPVPEHINTPEYWSALKEFMEAPGFPQPFYCPERKARERAVGIRAWARVWNQTNARTGQAYSGV